MCMKILQMQVILSNVQYVSFVLKQERLFADNYNIHYALLAFWKSLKLQKIVHYVDRTILLLMLRRCRSFKRSNSPISPLKSRLITFYTLTNSRVLKYPELISLVVLFLRITNFMLKVIYRCIVLFHNTQVGFLIRRSYPEYLSSCLIWVFTTSANIIYSSHPTKRDTTQHFRQFTR